MGKAPREYVVVNNEIGSQAYLAGFNLLNARDVRDAMQGDMDLCRDDLKALIPFMRECMPPGDNTMIAQVVDGSRIKLTIKRTGGQARIDKIKLLEHGVSAATIEECTVKPEGSETVLPERVTAPLSLRRTSNY